MGGGRGAPGPADPDVLRRSVASAARLELDALSPGAALRSAAGCAVVLVVALPVTGPRAAAASTVGALLASIPALSGARRRPLAAMVTTTFGIALSSSIGSVTANVSCLHLVVLASSAFAGGMLVALGDACSVVGTQAAMAFVVFGRFAESAPVAVQAAGYVAAGGALQVLLAAATRWPLALRPLRRALADPYRALADLANGDPERSGLSAGLALDGAGAALTAPQTFRRADVSALRSLVDEGRRIRVELVDAVDTLAGLLGARSASRQ
ncbi:MAG: hypothetical protein M0Z33_09680 [Actinomycetota bacterium]|nr:hypothetical protein [Actinomycetota bacterium]